MAKPHNKSVRPKGHGLAAVVNEQYKHVSKKVELAPVIQKAFGLVPDDDEELRRIKLAHAKPYIALKYYDPDYECFSDWQTNNLKAFSSLCEKLAGMTWSEILKSGGSSGHKTGLGYTQLDLSTVSEKSKRRLQLVQERISPDINFFELRVTQEARVHGFRAADAFFLVLLDQGHDVYKSK